MARIYNIATQRKFAERRKAKEKARLMVPQGASYTASFDREMAEAHAGWMAGDDEAKRRYFSLLGRRGGKAGRGELKKLSGQKGGLSTKKVERKAYVKGKDHGNYGKKRPKKPSANHLGPQKSLAVLQQILARRLRGEHTPLTWSQTEWQPPQIPKDINIVDER